MSFELLQSGDDNLRQMAFVEPVSNLYGFVQFAFAKSTSYCRCKRAGLLAGRIISNHTVDHDADGPCRHNKQHKDHALGKPVHRAPEGTKIEIDPFLFLEEPEGPDLKL